MRNDGPILCHPIPLTAVAILVINDHLLKGSELLPGLITGKLSDVVGLFFFPIFLFVIAWWAVQRLFDTDGSQDLIAGLSVAVTVAGFTSVNIWPWANDVAATYWGVFTMDPTDLFCLPITLVAWWWIRRQTDQKSPRWHWHHRPALKLAAVIAAAGASMATSYTPTPYVQWRIDGGKSTQAPQSQAIDAKLWFAKTGKEGAGLVIRFDNTSASERFVTIDDARLNIGSEEGPPMTMEIPADLSNTTIARSQSPEPTTSPSAGTPTEFTIGTDEWVSVYLPFPFDNNSAWNNNQRTGHLEVELHFADGSATNWRFAVDQDIYPGQYHW